MSELKPPTKVSPTGNPYQDILGAHTHSIDHRDSIAISETCGCFHCLATFSPDAIGEWIDVIDGVNVTALCPECGIDSVIGSASGYPIERVFLQLMRTHWFA